MQTTTTMPMPSPPDSLNQNSNNPFNNFLHTLLSDGNVMLSAVISLLLVILFVLLLHVYAKWFLAHTRRRRRSPSSVSVSHVLGPPRFHHFSNTLTFDTPTLSSSSTTKGLDASAISSIPLFVYLSDQNKEHGLECVVCLSVFEDNEVGREMPNCGHVFHVECIDVWLTSHLNCPICRAPVLIAEIDSVSSNDAARDEESEIVIEVSNSDENNESGIGAMMMSDSLSACSSSSSSSLSSQVAMTLSGSLKRMLSRNRSERKIHPSMSSIVDESND
ncbi:hypothetical protein CsSME_00016177 [Camellia sinensis var. sinensis]